ncbi:type 1 glutamine amidotransferase domain-containing protein [Winogradskyella maritima]|uniref:Type 1 glutamine amidotransferase domain-containing protein n=1 Tax=Winogradskyella maritima TaxID=1517766 RepID=A0ABV8AGM1_9FLAO|nr:type 1 glutamine amidotransferase domain-containing protein [Winogradskyella maritima]
MKFKILSIILCSFLGLSAQVSSERESKGNILFIMSNAKTYGNSDIETGTSFAEIVHAYDVFVKYNYKVDFLTPNGGSIHLGHYYKAKDPLQYRYYNDSDFMAHLNSTLTPSEVNPSQYKAVYYVGGGSAMYQVPENKAIQKISTTIYEQQNGVISAVCHGTAGLVNLKLSDGSYIVEGKQVNGFPDAFERKEKAYYKEFPFSIEQKIIAHGGDFKYSKKGWDSFTIAHDRLITGQDPTASAEVAELVVAKLENKK